MRVDYIETPAGKRMSVARAWENIRLMRRFAHNNQVAAQKHTAEADEWERRIHKRPDREADP